MESQEKKYIGYGYHGGGRKTLPEEQKKKYVTISVSGQPEEIERLKARAQEENKTVSRFILDNIKYEKEHNLLTDIIETFTSQSLTDDIEMADTAREIAEILGIKNYR